MSTLQKFSVVAETMDDVAEAGRAGVLDARERRLREAAEQARSASDDITAAVLAAADEFDEGPTIGALNTFIALNTAFARTLLLKAQERRPSFDDMRPLVAQLLAAYNALRAALGARASALPEVPEFLTDFLGDAS